MIFGDPKFPDVVELKRELATLRAENDRLRIDLSQTNARTENYEAEIERLREALRKIRDVYCDDDCLCVVCETVASALAVEGEKT